MIGQKWKILAKIYISNNHIENIDILSDYIALEIIDASNCQISYVNLKLKQLRKLNLSGNHIQEWPSLLKSNKLEYLNLNNNVIPEIFNEDKDILYA